MSETLINLNEHRIYYGKDGASVVRAGQTFEGSSDDAKRPGVVKASSDEGKAFLASQPEEGTEAVALERSEALHRKVLETRGLATAALRDKFDGKTGDTIKGTGEGRNPNQPSAGGPADITLPNIEDDNQPPPATAEGESAEFSSDAAQERASELGLDASQIDGTGKGGKITVADVEQAAKS